MSWEVCNIEDYYHQRIKDIDLHQAVDFLIKELASLYSDYGELMDVEYKSRGELYKAEIEIEGLRQELNDLRGI